MQFSTLVILSVNVFMSGIEVSAVPVPQIYNPVYPVPPSYIRPVVPGPYPVAINSPYGLGINGLPIRPYARRQLPQVVSMPMGNYPNMTVAHNPPQSSAASSLPMSNQMTTMMPSNQINNMASSNPIGKMAPTNQMAPPSNQMATSSNQMATPSNHMPTPSNHMPTPSNQMPVSNQMATPSHQAITPMAPQNTRREINQTAQTFPLVTSNSPSSSLKTSGTGPTILMYSANMPHPVGTGNQMNTASSGTTSAIPVSNGNINAASPVVVVQYLPSPNNNNPTLPASHMTPTSTSNSPVHQTTSTTTGSNPTQSYPIFARPNPPMQPASPPTHIQSAIATNPTQAASPFAAIQASTPNTTQSVGSDQ